MSTQQLCPAVLRNILILIAFVTAGMAQAQNRPGTYYVVVGGFAIHKNARRFTEHVLAENYPARYAFNPVRKLYYVYVLVTADKPRARQLAYRLRLESAFTGAWIYQGSLQGNEAIEGHALAAHDAEISGTPSPSENTSGKNTPTDTNIDAHTPAAAAASATSPADSTQNTAAVNPAGTTPVKPEGKEFIFRLTAGTDTAEVSGPVYIMQEDGTQPHRYAANQKVIVPPPASGKLAIVCNVIGYKLAKRIVPYNDPNIGGENAVTIKLVPVAKGNYIELENVKFFEHTAIFTPSSDNELAQLVALMSNPRCRIRIYGHTHSNDRGDITTLGTATNFFAPDPAANTVTQGSGKELSKLRAEAVKAYLVSKGIDATRINTKGYGAELAVYEQASANDRIEIEILRN